VVGEEEAVLMVGEGRGGFDGGRGRGGGRVRRFTLFEILRPDNLFCHRVVVAIAAAAGVEPEAECETAPLLPLKVTRSLSNIVPRFRPYLQFPRHNIFRP
jgi:hypothetical protein